MTEFCVANQTVREVSNMKINKSDDIPVHVLPHSQTNTHLNMLMAVNEPNPGLWHILPAIDIRIRINLNRPHSLDHSATSATRMRMQTRTHTRKLCWAAPLRCASASPCPLRAGNSSLTGVVVHGEA